MENIVYLFTSFLSCIIVMGLLFQFMNDRYEKVYGNSKLYNAAWLISVFIITLVNQLRIVLANATVNIIVFGIICMIMYKDRDGRKYPPVRLDALRSIQPIHPFAKFVLTHSCVC